MSTNSEIDALSKFAYICVTFKSFFILIISACIIAINVLSIASLLVVKRTRTTQNLLLINVGFACILFSLASTLSVSFTTLILYTKKINMFMCRFVGFLILSSSHCLMFSYTLVAFVRFLTIIYPFNKNFVSACSINAHVTVIWLLAFLLPGVNFMLSDSQIVFQAKAKICTIKQQSPLLLFYFCTGYIIPLLLITLMNLVTYLNVTQARYLPFLARKRRTRFNKRKRRNLRLLRQFSFFTVIFLLGWTPFILIEVLDKAGQLPDELYLFSLVLPLVCILIDSYALLYWNGTINHRVQIWWQTLRMRSQTIDREQTIDVHGHDVISFGTNANASAV